MPLLDKFNQNVSSFEQEVNNLADIRETFQKLARLVTEYEIIKQNLDNATQSIDSAKASIDQEKTAVQEKLLALESTLNAEIKEINKQLISLDKLLKEKTEAISEDNKKFYNDFANTVQTRLDNNKMEIKQLIDQDSQSTRTQINELKKEVFEFEKTEQEAHRDYRELLTTESTKLQKQIDTLKNIILGLSIPTLIITLATLIILIVK